MPGYGHNPPEQRGRKPLKASVVKSLSRMAEGQARMRIGHGLTSVDGQPLMLPAGGPVVRIKTTTSVTARSGTTPGTGSAALVTWNGTTLDTGVTITIRNLSATAGASGKYGFAALLDGAYWMISLEC